MDLRQKYDINLICFLEEKALILLVLLHDALLFQKMTSSSPNQFLIVGMKKLSRIPGYTRPLIVKSVIVHSFIL